jgi:23S rRNA (cytidine1920-2'-O)/16S rRNA (cytidine1409-2'-O)-methyltransferase
MSRQRLDKTLVERRLVSTRSQAASYIRLKRVSVDGQIVDKPGFPVSDDSEIRLNEEEQFVSRAALKLKSVADKLKLDFTGKVVLDVGSSTGGFTEFALSRGAKKVIAVDVGTNQLSPKLRANPKIELREKTDIRQVNNLIKIDTPEIILIDVSFISLRQILPHIAKNIASQNSQIVAMLKPQFETGQKTKNAGVVKNDSQRRKILHDFEIWARQYFIIKSKADSQIAGARGNRERFYLLNKLAG